MTKRNKILSLVKKIHKWGALATSLPLLIITITGILLTFRTSCTRIQPETQIGSFQLSEMPLLPVEEVVTIAQSVPEAGIRGWPDIQSVEVKLQKGIYSVRTKNNYEVQVDFRTGVILSRAPRLTSLLVQLHEGSFFKSPIILNFFKMTGIIFFILYLSGIIVLANSYYQLFKKHKSINRSITKRRLFDLSFKQKGPTHES
jgi:uncharacterized iron-regulated membrane protein